MVRNGLLLLALVAIAVAAAVDGFRNAGSAEASSSPESAETETGQTETGPEPDEEIAAAPEAPSGGALPGSLVLASGPACRLQVLQLAGPSLSNVGMSTGCEIWASPGGQIVATTVPRDAGDASARRELVLARLGDPPSVERELGRIAGDPTWSADGTRLAWCNGEGTTIVLDLRDDSRSEVPGCEPRFSPAGGLLTTPPRFPDQLLRNGEIVLAGADLLSGFEDPSRLETGLDLLAFDEAPDGLLAVTALALDPLGSRAVLELWRDGELEVSVVLPARFATGNARFGDYLRFNPSGTVLAVGAAPNADVVFVDLRIRRPQLDVPQTRGFDWSADGGWLAIANGQEIVVYGTNDAQPVYRLPVQASGLAWSPT